MPITLKQPKSYSSKSARHVLIVGVAVMALTSFQAHAQDDLNFEDSPIEAPAESPILVEDNIQPLLPEEGTPDTVAPSAITEVESAPVAPEAAELEPVVPGMPEAVAAEEFDENLFFDAEELVPSTELSRKGAPSKVNPAVSPGSRLVISTKNYNSGSKQARLVAAERAMKLGRYESALGFYDELHQANRSDPNVMMGRAIALQRLGRDDEALQAYETLLDKRPRNVEAQVNLQGLLSKRYPSVALRNLIELHEDNPGDISIVAQLAVVEAQLANYPEAIRYLGMAASMEPENANHIYNMAIIADRAGDRKAAIGYYEEALEIDTLYGHGKSIPRETVFERLAQLR